MGYAFEPQAAAAQRLELDGRETLRVTGVQDVESFDEASVVLRTALGTLLVRGEGLHLQTLSLEGGLVALDGRVDSLVYEDDAPGGGLLARLFR